MFARLLLIGKSRNIDTQELLSYALKSASLPFANINVGMVKTDKAKLMHAIEESAPNPVVSEVPTPNALVVDAMALLQQLTKCEAIPSVILQTKSFQCLLAWQSVTSLHGLIL